MLIDMAQQYDTETIAHLRDLWEKVVLRLANSHDHKKLFSFLNRVGIVAIDEKEKFVYIWVSNEFVLTQVKKFFQKSLKEAVESVYNSQFWIKIIVYPPFLNGSELLLNLKKILKVSDASSQWLLSKKEVKRELTDHFGILFEPVFRFDTFVVWSATTIAFSASKAVAEQPGVAYNPLFLYGNVWLGKTHLMQAIGNEVIQKYPDKVVVYFPATKLIDEIIAATRTNKLPNLYKKFEWVDVLMIDDIQFLAEKEKTQEIFHTIFNDFQSQKKQVILSSDRPPRELLHIEPRLKSRFSLGLVADIKSPDLETRIAILQTKLEAKAESLDFSLLELVAKYVKDNVRELEWALNILLTRKKILNVELGESDVVSCLKTLWYSIESDQSPNPVVNIKSQQNFAQLVEQVASYYSVSVSDLKSDSRIKEVTVPRQLLMYVAKKYFHWTFEKIWDYFGGKNHASVIYAVDNVEKKLKYDEDVQHDYKVFMEWLWN
jgi:chromosomal replication initiator protein